jgi:hypothetical protein
MTNATDLTARAQEDGSALNCGAPYGVPRETSRIPLVVSDRGHLTNFHTAEDETLSSRVTNETATHYGVHHLTVLAATALTTPAPSVTGEVEKAARAVRDSALRANPDAWVVDGGPMEALLDALDKADAPALPASAGQQEQGE